jgi:hypothetical protein
MLVSSGGCNPLAARIGYRLARMCFSPSDSDEHLRGLLAGYDRLRISGAVPAKGGYVGGT